MVDGIVPSMSCSNVAEEGPSKQIYFICNQPVIQLTGTFASNAWIHSNPYSPDMAIESLMVVDNPSEMGTCMHSWKNKESADLPGAVKLISNNGSIYISSLRIGSLGSHLSKDLRLVI